MRPSAVLILVLAVGAVAPFSGIYPLFLMKCLAFAIFAIAFNFFTGNVGLLSIGHAAFFGMGAYICGYTAKEWGLTAELALLAGVVVAGCLGWIFGVLAIRRKGIYFAMITLALAQMVYFFLVQAPFTGAEDGLQRIPRAALFGLVDLHDDLRMYYFILALMIGVLALVQFLTTSPFGLVLKAIHDSEPRSLSLGYNVAGYKLTAFVISACLAGLAGGLKALTLGLAALSDAHWTQSGNVILMCLLGGLGTTLGPIVGAVLVVMLETKLSDIGVISIAGFSLDLSTKVPILVGVVFMICVLIFRKGIVGELLALRVSRSKSDAVTHEK